MRLFLLLALAAGLRAQSAMPKFEDYPAGPVWKGPSAPLQFRTPTDRVFRTRFEQAAAGPAVFAGSLREAVWGCGSNCWAGGWIDLATGLLHTLPIRQQHRGIDHRILCAGAGPGCGYEYRLTSRLLIFRCGWNPDAQGRNHPEVHYFVWEQGRFRQLAHIPAPRQRR